jgi:serine/threonine-protein kinase
VTVALQPVGTSEATAGVLASLAQTLGGIPRVLLHDTDGSVGVEPVVQPSSSEMPQLADRSARLQLFGEIARGGMGAVLKGRDVDLGRDLAVKVLLEKHSDHPDLMRRFIEEAQIAGQLQHPGIVPIYELGAFADRRPYFAMKLVKGRTLAAVLADRGEASCDRMGLLGILLQVAQTMAYAHARGVIHRDLKPSNIMVGSFGEVQVMDWGLAKVLPKGGRADDATAGQDGSETVIATPRSGSDPDLSQAGSVMGTPAYMAPEQARGEVDAIDKRADVFALGSMLCEVLTGEPAFTGRSSAEIQRKAARGDLDDAWTRLESCEADVELVSLAIDCLAPEPDDRPREASVFVDRLSSYLRSIEQRLRAAELQRAAEHARAEEAEQRAQVERQRRRYQVGLAASLLMLSVVGGLSFSYWMRQRQAWEARVTMEVQQAVFLRDYAAAEPQVVSRWEAARRRIDEARRKLIDLDAPAALETLQPLGQEVQAGWNAARRVTRLIETLTEAQTNAVRSPNGAEDFFASAFHEAGLDLHAMTPAALGAAIRGLPEPVMRAVVAALDDWALWRRLWAPTHSQWRQPLEAARAADQDPFRDRVRAALLESDAATRTATLRALVVDPKSAELSPHSAVLLARALCEEDEVPTQAAAALLRAVAVRHPEDFMVNLALANILLLQTPPAREEAVGYLRAARALRSAGGNALVRVLKILGRADEAAAVAADLYDRRGGSWTQLAYACLSNHQSRVPSSMIDAILATGRQAVERFPDRSSTHAMLGTALLARGQREEAIGELRAALQRTRTGEARDSEGTRAVFHLDPPPNLSLNDPLFGKLVPILPQFVHDLLGIALREKGDFAAALAEFQAAHKINGTYSITETLVAQTEPMARLTGRLAAVLRSADRPTDVEELRTFATMAYHVRHYNTAASLFAAVPESKVGPAPQGVNSKLVDDRYNAACASALASCGQGQDAPPQDDPGRALRRRQAMQWLRANLALRDSQRQPAAAGGLALAHWEHDPDLEGVRDAKALEVLPEKERRAWQALWAEVERRVSIDAARSWLGASVF